MATASKHLPALRPLTVKPDDVFVTEQTLVFVDTVMARPWAVLAATAVIVKLRFTFTEVAMPGTLGVRRTEGTVAVVFGDDVFDDAVFDDVVFDDDVLLVEPPVLEVPFGVVLAVVDTAAGVTHFDWFAAVVTVPVWHLTCLVAASTAT